MFYFKISETKFVLTNNQLSDVLPVQLTALLVDQSDCYSTLDALKTQARQVTKRYLHLNHLYVLG